MLLTMRDGSGDRLAASLHRPRTATDKPLAMLAADVIGCEGSIYIRSTATALLKADYPVLRLNLRGSPPSRPTCRDHYHAGRSEDLHDVVEDLPPSIQPGGQFTSPRNAVYNQWMLNNLKKEALVTGADISADERNAVIAARNVIEYRRPLRCAPQWVQRRGRQLQTMPSLVVSGCDPGADADHSRR